MRHFKATLLFFSFFTFSIPLKAELPSEVRQDIGSFQTAFQCISLINRHLHAYRRVPGVSVNGWAAEGIPSAHSHTVYFSGVHNEFLTRTRTSPTLNSMTVYSFDSGNARYIFANGVAWRCFYPNTLRPDELRIDRNALIQGSENVLERRRAVARRAGISCEFAREETLHHHFSRLFSNLPRLYRNHVIHSLENGLTPLRPEELLQPLQRCSRLGAGSRNGYVNNIQAINSIHTNLMNRASTVRDAGDSLD